jgi:hypothetical protein
MLGDRVRLTDLLAAVSVATDLGMGQEPEKAIRACLVATALARRMGTPETEVSDDESAAQRRANRRLGRSSSSVRAAVLGPH